MSEWQVVAHLTAENAPLYRAILTTLVEAHLGPEDVLRQSQRSPGRLALDG